MESVVLGIVPLVLAAVAFVVTILFGIKKCLYTKESKAYLMAAFCFITFAAYASTLGSNKIFIYSGVVGSSAWFSMALWYAIVGANLGNKSYN